MVEIIQKTLYYVAMDIFRLVWPQGVQFLTSTTKEDALSTMISQAATHGFIKDPKALESGIYSRERIISTGIGLGVAIPHAKLSGIQDFFITIGVLKEGVDWDAIDEEPVRIVLMIVGPDNQQTQYLQILARLSLIIKNSQHRERILASSRPEDVLTVFESF